MKRLTVIPEDKIITIDGKSAFVDMGGVPGNVHAVQWYATWGEVEFATAGNVREQNKAITELPDYALSLIPLAMDYFEEQEAQPTSSGMPSL
jgi:hypothetical protein|tara:strand:- start:1362 stop:1637 length:276 start_codon:yes stop_codon:yes gene_type:complete